MPQLPDLGASQLPELGVSQLLELGASQLPELGTSQPPESCACHCLCWVLATACVGSLSLSVLGACRPPESGACQPPANRAAAPAHASSHGMRLLPMPANRAAAPAHASSHAAPHSPAAMQLPTVQQPCSSPQRLLPMPAAMQLPKSALHHTHSITQPPSSALRAAFSSAAPPKDPRLWNYTTMNPAHHPHPHSGLCSAAQPLQKLNAQVTCTTMNPAHQPPPALRSTVSIGAGGRFWRLQVRSSIKYPRRLQEPLLHGRKQRHQHGGAPQRLHKASESAGARRSVLASRCTTSGQTCAHLCVCVCACVCVLFA